MNCCTKEANTPGLLLSKYLWKIQSFSYQHNIPSTMVVKWLNLIHKVRTDKIADISLDIFKNLCIHRRSFKYMLDRFWREKICSLTKLSNWFDIIVIIHINGTRQIAKRTIYSPGGEHQSNWWKANKFLWDD